MLTLSKRFVITVFSESIGAECTLHYRETLFTHQPWQQCTCCHAHHSQTHGYRQRRRSVRVHPSHRHILKCTSTHLIVAGTEQGKDKGKMYFTCSLFNLPLFYPSILLLSSLLFIDSLVEEWRMFPSPSESSKPILQKSFIWMFYINT